MKIGLIVPGFSANERDWCIPVLLHLVRRLSEAHEVHVFPLRYPHRRTPYGVYAAAVHPQGGADASGVERVRLLRRTLSAVLAEHRRSAFDALHGVWADEPGFVAAVAGRLLRVGSVVTLAGGELVAMPDIGYGGRLSRINRVLTWIALRSADRVTVGSDYLRRLAQARVPAGRLRSIPFGVETRLFAVQGRGMEPVLGAGRPKLLHAASLVPVKDQAMLLRAMALVAAHVTAGHLHIVGDGPLRGQLQRQARSLGIAARVTFHGAVAHDRMPAYYRAADLCLLSSRYESQGLATLEAAACGRGSIGTAVGVMPELGPGARTAPVGDAAALAEAVVDALSAPGVVAEMGQAARAVIQDRYTLGHTTQALLAVYSGI